MLFTGAAYGRSQRFQTTVRPGMMSHICKQSDTAQSFLVFYQDPPTGHLGLDLGPNKASTHLPSWRVLVFWFKCHASLLWTPAGPAGP